MEAKLLTPQQVADFLQVDFRTVYHLLRTGKLAGVKVGRVWRIRPEDVEEYLRSYSNRKAGKPEAPQEK
jgi:excisionase family DNA binding protein